MIELARQGGVRYGDDTVAEAVEFLEWLQEDNFVFLGYREYEGVEVDGEPHIVADPEWGLGILADVSGSSFSSPVPISSLGGSRADHQPRPASGRRPTDQDPGG